MKLAIIGGSLLGEIDYLSKTIEEKIKTPFGEPSGNFISGYLGDSNIVYINRHGNSHHLAPHQINYRANMFGLKLLEVTHVIAVTAVGGITEQMAPMQWVVPDQIIDYTYGRIQTFNDGNEGEINHIDFSYPFDENLRQQLYKAVSAEKQGCLLQATYGATQGPRLETVAEIQRLERDGCDIVGMTAMPEATLARELEMPYATLSLVVNWAAGKSKNAQEIVVMDDIRHRVAAGNKQLLQILNNVF